MTIPQVHTSVMIDGMVLRLEHLLSTTQFGLGKMGTREQQP